jgi:triacylglycerol lipase
MGMLNLFKNETGAVVDTIQDHMEYMFTGKKSKFWDTGKHTVMLLHGYLQGDASWKRAEKFLHENGFNTDAEAYPFWQDLTQIEKTIENRATKIAERVQAKISIVGHSLGGLVARTVAQHQPKLFERVISLGAPHHGTYMAMFGMFTKSAQQMLPGTEYLNRLNSYRLPENVRFYSLYSEHDLLVIPRNSANLAGAINMVVKDVGHVGLIGPSTKKLILDILLGKLDNKYSPYPQTLDKALKEKSRKRL